MNSRRVTKKGIGQFSINHPIYSAMAMEMSSMRAWATVNVTPCIAVDEDEYSSGEW
jgi:hypothetical protein